MMSGGIVGGITAGVLGNKLKITNAYMPIMLSGLVMIPVGLALLFDAPYLVTYVMITAACVLAFALITIANIQVISLIQGETPAELTGKVMSLVVMLPFLANALGQFIYGIAFEHLATMPYIVMFVTVGMVVVIAIYTRKSFKIYGV